MSYTNLHFFCGDCCTRVDWTKSRRFSSVSLMGACIALPRAPQLPSLVARCFTTTKHREMRLWLAAHIHQKLWRIPEQRTKGWQTSVVVSSPLSLCNWRTSRNKASFPTPLYLLCTHTTRPRFVRTPTRWGWCGDNDCALCLLQQACPYCLVVLPSVAKKCEPSFVFPRCHLLA